MAYIAEYERPYEGGYVDLPSETTPEMAEFINARDDAIIKIEEFLADLDIGSLGGDYALASEAGYALDVSMNNEYVLTISLKNKDGNNLSSKSIDLPIESMIVDVDYTAGKLVLTLQNGNTVDVDVSDMVRGLVPTSRTIAGLDLADDITKEELKDAIGIYDDTVTAGEIKPWLYDTNGEEVIVGVFGGKPLYRKIFHVDVTTSNQSAEIRLSDVLDNFSQIENIVDYVVYTAAHNRLPIVYVSSQFQGSSAMAFVSVRDDVIRINHGTAISFTNARFRVVLEYTKTTDGAGSGNNLNPYGIYSATLEDVKKDIEDLKESGGGGGGDSTIRYVNDESDSNFDWIQVKNANGEWINVIQAHTQNYPLYMSSANEGGFAGYAYSDWNGQAGVQTPIVTFDESMNMTVTASAGGGGSAISELVDLTRFKKIKLYHKSTLSNNTQYFRVTLFVASELKQYLYDKVVASVELISAYTGTKEGDIELDISALEGEYYIGICCHVNSGTTSTEISNMYME